MYQALLQDSRLALFALKIDRETAAAARAEGCPLCGAALHVASFARKPRGGPGGLGREHDRRFSFCCARDGCRSRLTPASLRFLGRRVYVATSVVLVSVMRDGATPSRMAKLRAVIGVSRRTVERWRVWWRTAFPSTPFWRAARGAITPPVVVGLLPASLLERFRGDDEARLISILRFLRPLTGGTRTVSV